MAYIGYNHDMIGLKNIHITPQILKQVASIDEFKGLWAGLDEHTTALSLLGDVASYGQAFHNTLMELKGHEITLQVLCALHANIMGEKGGSDLRSAPYDMVIPVFAGDGGEIETAAPDDIEPLLVKLLSWVDNELNNQDGIHPLIAVSVFSSVFLQIAPFYDGNMKLLRLLMVIYLLKSGYAYVPYVLFDPIMLKKGRDIYHALSQNQDSLASGKPDWSSWLQCFLGVLYEQKNILLDRLREDKKDLSHLPTLSARIMKLFEEHKRLQMKQIIKFTNGRRATIKLRLSELVEQGYLKRHGKARSTWYSLD